MPVKAVFWDIDGTYVDSEPTHNRSLVDTLARWDIHPSEALLRRVIGTSVEATHAILVAAHGAMPGIGDFIAGKTRAYLARIGELQLRGGVESAERLLAERSLRRAFVSNSDRIVVDANLAAVGVFEHGLVTVSRNDVLRGKPDPEPYLRAAYLLDVAPQDCLIVEDSPTGVASGLAAGMTVIAWPEHGGASGPFPEGAWLANPAALVPTLVRLIAL